MVSTVIAAISLRGYCRTLRPPSPDRFGKTMGSSAFAPAMRITKLTTIASTGRLMKISVNDFMSMLLSSGERTRLACSFRRPRRNTVGRTPALRKSSRWRRRHHQHARARALPRSESENLSTFLSRVHRSRVHLRLRRKIVVDRYGHPVAQLENAGADNGFASFQAFCHRNKIATRLPYAHKLLTDHLRFLACFLVLLLFDYKNRIPEGRVRHC